MGAECGGEVTLERVTKSDVWTEYLPLYTIYPICSDELYFIYTVQLSITLPIISICHLTSLYLGKPLFCWRSLGDVWGFSMRRDASQTVIAVRVLRVYTKSTSLGCMTNSDAWCQLFFACVTSCVTCIRHI